MKKFVQYIFDTIVWLAILVFVISYVTASLSNSSLLGNNHLYIVQSGSMEPSIMTGDIIISSAQVNYEKNDVVTFRDSAVGIVTHRIIDVVGGYERRFVTKGDANRSNDNSNISQEQIIGKVILVVPKLGYLVVYSRQPIGTILLIGIPGIIIVIEEIIKMQSKSDKRDKT